MVDCSELGLLRVAGLSLTSLHGVKQMVGHAPSAVCPQGLGLLCATTTVWCLCPQFMSDPSLWVRGLPLRSIDSAAGVRQDNRAAERPGFRKTGYRFFSDDEDTHELEELLQALCFLQSGETWVPAKPWEAGSMGIRISERDQLPEDVQKLLQNFLKDPDSTPELDCRES